MVQLFGKRINFKTLDLLYNFSLAPKTYMAIDYDEIEDDKIACKGVSKRTNSLRYEQFKDTLYNGTTYQMTNISFRDQAGTMKTIKTTKRGLVNVNNKSFTNDDLVTTSPFKKPRYM